MNDKRREAPVTIGQVVADLSVRKVHPGYDPAEIPVAIAIQFRPERAFRVAQHERDEEFKPVFVEFAEGVISVRNLLSVSLDRDSAVDNEFIHWVDSKVKITLATTPLRSGNL
jgi:hypothetical protein